MKKTIAFLGDSITFGYDLADQSKKYTTLIANALDLTEINHGITGTLMAKAGLNQTDENDFVSRMHLVDEGDIAVIFGGTNDYFWSDRPISGEEDDRYFMHALETLCKHYREVRGDKPTLFVAPYPHNGIGNYWGGETWNTSSRHDTSAKNYNGHSLVEYAEAIQQVCEKYGFPCLNLHKDFPFDWRIHTTDGCHPNEAGHALLAEYIGKKVEEL